MINAPKGALYECGKFGLKMDRQLNAAINLYLQMEVSSTSPKLFEELMKPWSGFTLTGEEADEAPMNSNLISIKSGCPCFLYCV